MELARIGSNILSGATNNYCGLQTTSPLAANHSGTGTDNEKVLKLRKSFDRNTNTKEDHVCYLPSHEY